MKQFTLNDLKNMKVPEMIGAISFELLEKLKDGKIFSVTFVKRTDGTLREMTARYGVGENPLNESESMLNKLLLVWDLQKKAYRNIPLEGLTQVKHHVKVWNNVSYQ